MTRYNQGFVFEQATKRHLERAGWTVFRSAGSHSPVDLVCIGNESLPNMLVQCKKERSRGSYKYDEEILRAVKVPPDGRWRRKMFIKRTNKHVRMKDIDTQEESVLPLHLFK